MYKYDYIILETKDKHFELNDPEKWKSLISSLCEENNTDLDEFLLWKYKNHKKIYKFHKEQQEDPKLVFDGPLDLLERAEKMSKFFDKWLYMSE